MFAAAQIPGAPVVALQMPLAHELEPVAPGEVALHAKVVSTKQVAEQPSPAVVLPSSQPSPDSSTLLPQPVAGAHTPGAPAVALHTLLAHELEPVEPGAVALHAKVVSTKQVAEQPSLAVVFPSSQPSPASSTLLPQPVAGAHTPGAPDVVLQRPLSHELEPVAPGDVARLELAPADILKAIEVRELITARLRGLGWEPQIGLREGIASTYEWYLANGAVAS